MSKYTEKEILKKVIEVVKNNPGIRTSELINKTKEVMKPNGDDLKILKGRKDTKFSQKVRNIVSHNSGKGFIEYKEKERKDRRWFIKDNKDDDNGI